MLRCNLPMKQTLSKQFTTHKHVTFEAKASFQMVTSLPSKVKKKPSSSPKTKCFQATHTKYKIAMYYNLKHLKNTADFIKNCILFPWYVHYFGVKLNITI